MPVYVFERMDIIGGGRGQLVELLRRHWARYAEVRHGLRMIGVWATIGSTRRWPEADMMWEMDDWDHFAQAQAATHPMEDKDPYWNEMWRQALALRSGGTSWLLIPSGFSPDLVQMRATGALGKAILFEEIKTLPGKMTDYHAALQAEYLPKAVEKGLKLIGAYRHGFRPNEGVNLWGIPNWQTMKDAFRDELEYPGGPEWFERCSGLLEDYDAHILASPPDRELRT